MEDESTTLLNKSGNNDPKNGSTENIALDPEKNKTYSGDNLINDDLAPPKEVACWRRHWGKLLSLFILIIVLILIFAVVVPKVAIQIMEKLLLEADILVEEMEVKNIEKGVATIRLQAWMSVDAPIDVSGYTEEGIFEMKMPDPLDRSVLSSIGRVVMPSIIAEGTLVFINVTTILYIDSDRLFHAFLTDAVANATLNTWLEGDITLTAIVPVYKELTATIFWSKNVVIDGMDGMEYKVDNFYLLNDTTSTELHLLFHLSVYNPSQFYSSFPMELYNIDLEIYIEGEYVGQMIPLGLLVSKGWSANEAVAILIKTDSNADEIGQFFGDYLMGIDVPVDVNGTLKVELGLPHTDEYPTYLNIFFPMPGTTANLIPELYSSITSLIPPFDLEAIGLLASPLTFSMTIYRLALDAFIGEPCNDTIDRVDETFDPPVVVPASPHTVCVPLTAEVSSHLSIKD